MAAKAATTTIPIVFSIGVDPIAFGLVASLNRPGGNATGVTNLNLELGPKQLEVLHELLPAATVMAALVNPTNPNADLHSSDLQAAARKLGIQLHIFHASSERDFETAFASLVQTRASLTHRVSGYSLVRANFRRRFDRTPLMGPSHPPRASD